MWNKPQLLLLQTNWQRVPYIRPGFMRHKEPRFPALTPVEVDTSNLTMWSWHEYVTDVGRRLIVLFRCQKILPFLVSNFGSEMLGGALDLLVLRRSQGSGMEEPRRRGEKGPRTC